MKNRFLILFFFAVSSLAFAQSNLSDFLGSWAPVGPSLGPIFIKKGGTLLEPTLLRYDDCNGTPCTGPAYASISPWAYRPTAYGYEQSWVNVRDPECKVVLTPWSDDPKEQKQYAQVGFFESYLVENEGKLTDTSGYCENLYDPSVCSQGNLTEFIFKHLNHPDPDEPEFSCSSDMENYQFVPAPMTFTSLNGEWSAASGVLKNGKAESLAKGVHLIFSSTADSFSLDYGICTSPTQCLPGSDVFASLKGRIVGNTLIVSCKGKDGLLQDKILGEPKDKALFLSLPGRDGSCDSDSTPTLKIIRNGANTQLSLEGTEASIEGEALILKDPVKK